MKDSKWVKWQVGAFSALGLALLFHEVKSSDSFAAAVAKDHSESSAAASQQVAESKDPVMNEWRNQRNDSSGTNGTNSGSSSNSGTERRGHRSFTSSDSNRLQQPSGSSGLQQQPSGGSSSGQQTRTSHS